MEKSYTNYLNELSGNRMEILEEIITKKYKKFKKLYKILSNLSSDIAHISYRFSDDENSLSVDITVNQSIDVYDFVKQIYDENHDRYDIVTDHDGKVIYLSIQLQED